LYICSSNGRKSSVTRILIEAVGAHMTLTQRHLHKPIALLISILAPLCLGACQQPAQPAVEYTVTDLRPDLCCDNVFPTGVNNTGYVAGYTYPNMHAVDSVNGADATYVVPSPFVWHACSLTALATLGGISSNAHSVGATLNPNAAADSANLHMSRMSHTSHNIPKLTLATFPYNTRLNR
jgi:hypothetical protein